MWKQQESGRVETPTWFEPVILAATLAMIPVLILQRDAHSAGWQTAANAANWLIWAVFAAEIAFVLAVASRRRAALRAHWLDSALVVVTVPAYGRLFSQLRLVRLVRLLRFARVGVVVARALQAERRLTSKSVFRFASIATIFLVFVAGAVEATVDSGDFKSFWDGVWWAVVTVTTVGYGDLVPHSVGGRLVAMLLMVGGIGFISVLTATISSFFVKADRQDERVQSQEERAEMADSLKRIEADLAYLKASLEPGT
jgi:voltage-gated potassium channel